MNTLERRFYAGEVEFRATPTGGKLVGYAAVYNRFSQNLGGFVEQVAPGAFDKTLGEADIRGLFNHDPNMVLGRNTSETLQLASDTTGLHYEIDVPNTQAARDVAALVERKDVTGSSFSFQVMPGGESWGFTPQDYPLRTLLEVKLYDVGPVTFPAYVDTEAQLARSLRALVTDERTLELVLAAAGRNELRSLINGEIVEPGEQPTPDLAMYQRRLELARRSAVGR